MNVGDHIYYFQKIGKIYETIPAIIIQVSPIRKIGGLEKIKISGNFPNGQKEVWVLKSSCRLQHE